jgi:hypothetical protein
MPNHYVVVGLGAIHYPKDESLHDDFEPAKIEELTGKCLCDLAIPIPEDLQSIIAGRPRSRSVHKKTGEVLRSVNGAFDREDRDQWDQANLTHDEQNELIRKHGHADWYDWCKDNWGTKWGTYGLVVKCLQGDGDPVLISFQCAWGPPHAEAMQKIEQYLKTNYGVASIVWSGHNPYNNSVVHLDFHSDFVVPK